LGDTAYEQFNSIGRYFEKTFKELGAESIYPAGEGNSQF
jgi:sulfite reductase alpha subunit-like flavoprotein